MNKALCCAVYSKDEIDTDERIKELVSYMMHLPPGIYWTLFSHYQLGNTVDEISAETGHPPQLIETWLRSGISLLQIFSGVYRQ